MKYARANVVGEGVILEVDIIFFPSPNFQILFCTLGFQTLLRKTCAGKGDETVLDNNLFLINLS